MHEVEAKLFEFEIPEELILVCGQMIGRSGFQEQCLDNFLPCRNLRSVTCGLKFFHVSVL